MQIADLALQRAKYKHLSDSEWRWFLQQEEGRQRTADKLPAFAAIPDWWYPVRLSCEQCSSELTARYKAQLFQAKPFFQQSGLTAERSFNPQDGLSAMVDLTGGYGIDTLFLSRHFAHTDYVEQDAELCRIAAHNFSLPIFPLQGDQGGLEGLGVLSGLEALGAVPSITVHNTTAEEFLRSLPSPSPYEEVKTSFQLIFLDPARRDSHGGKVFRLQDCTPDVTALLPTLLRHLAPEGRILLKLSPMLDITQALKELSSIPNYQLPTTNYQSPLTWDVHIVAVKNEVKEVLLLSRPLSSTPNPASLITCMDLSEPQKAFSFTREEEQSAQAQLLHAEMVNGKWLYEPNVTILKAGAYKLIANRFHLQKLDPNTHLYISDRLVPDFPGRIWRIVQTITNLQSPISNANILVRNYPLTPEQLKKKLRLRDGGTAFVIGVRIAGRPTLLLAERV